MNYSVHLIHCMTCIVAALQGVELGQIHVSIETFTYHMFSQARNKAHAEQYSCIQMDEIITLQPRIMIFKYYYYYWMFLAKA